MAFIVVASTFLLVVAIVSMHASTVVSYQHLEDVGSSRSLFRHLIPNIRLFQLLV